MAKQDRFYSTKHISEYDINELNEFHPVKQDIKNAVECKEQLVEGFQHIIDRFSSEAVVRERLETTVEDYKRINEEQRLRIIELEAEVANTHNAYRGNKHPEWFMIHMAGASEETQEALEVIADFIEDDTKTEEETGDTMERCADVVYDFRRTALKVEKYLNGNRPY